MSSSLTIAGRLDVTTDAEGGHRAFGTALELAIVAARLGLLVDLVAITAAEIDSDLRGPIAAEGVGFERVVAPTEALPDEFQILGSPFEEALRHAARREALVCTLDLAPTLVHAILREADARRTLRVLAVTAGDKVSNTLLRDVDLLICDLESARRWCSSQEESVTARGLARRLFAFGPKRVVIVDRRGSGSVAFDGRVMLPIDFGARARSPSAISVFSATLVARLLAGDRPRLALAAAVRCAESESTDSDVLPGLPTTAALGALVARPQPASLPTD